MKLLVRFALACALALLSGAGLPQATDAYPSKPIRLIVPFGPGGASDTVARILQPRLAQLLGQEMFIEYRPGAAGNIGMELAARAAPDGYTLFLGNVGAIAINPAVFGAALKVEPLRDFLPVTLIADVPGLLIANPAFPPNSVRELVAYARAHPGEVSFGSSGNGSVSRLDMERLREIEGLDMTHVPYRAGAGQAVTDVIGGHVPVMFVTIASAIRQVHAGMLKPLAVTTAQRLPSLPNVPTMVESGYPQFVSSSWQGIFVPAGTPERIVRRLHAAFVRALNEPEIQLRFSDGSARVAMSESPEEFARFLAAESTRWSELVKRSGATMD